MISLQQLYDAEERAIRAKAERDRYRAALESIADEECQEHNGRWLCPWCGPVDPEHDNSCPVFIASRALHPEEDA